MSLPDPIQYLGWGAVVVPLMGIGIIFAVRHRPWLLFVWFPTTALVAYETAWFARKALGLSVVRGPDAIGVGIAYAVLLPVVLLGLAALVACFITRPRKKEQLRPWIVLSALATFLAVGIALQRFDRASMVRGYTLVYVDGEGQPRRGVAVSLKILESGLGVERRGLATDQAGRIDFTLRKGQNAEVEFIPALSRPWSLSPTGWITRIEPDQKLERAVVRHLWAQSVGSDMSVSQGFQEWVQLALPISITIPVPVRSELGSPALEKRVLAALATGSDAELVAGCIPGLELIPTLAKQSDVSGLRQSARILYELEHSRQALWRKAVDLQGRPGDPDFKNEIRAWATWAHCPGEVEPPSVLKKAESRLDTYAAQLGEFALSQLPNRLLKKSLFG